MNKDLTMDEIKQIIGTKYVPFFDNWMRGRTFSIRSDGKYVYYARDIEQFQKFLIKHKEMQSIKLDFEQYGGAR